MRWLFTTFSANGGSDGVLYPIKWPAVKKRFFCIFYYFELINFISCCNCSSFLHRFQSQTLRLLFNFTHKDNFWPIPWMVLFSLNERKRVFCTFNCAFCPLSLCWIHLWKLIFSLWVDCCNSIIRIRWYIMLIAWFQFHNLCQKMEEREKEMN